MKKDRPTTFHRSDVRPDRTGPERRIEKRDQASVIGDGMGSVKPTVSFDRPIPTESKKKEK